MNLLPVLALLLSMVVAVMIGSIALRSPQQTLQSACIEGVAWSSCFFVAFSAEFLLLASP